MSGQITVVPGYVFPEQATITTAKLNSAANPTMSVDENAVTFTEIQDNLVEPSITTLTGTTPTWTMIDNREDQLAKITLTGNTTLAMSGLVAGMTGFLVIVQDGTGGRTLTLPATSIVVSAGGGAVTLTGTANSIDRGRWWYNGTNILWGFALNFT